MKQCLRNWALTVNSVCLFNAMFKSAANHASHARSLGWDRASRMLEFMFNRLGINSYPNVLMGDGYAHFAYSIDNRAVVIQPYQGKANFVRQYTQLRKLRDQLVSTEPHSRVMAAFYFQSEMEKLSRINGIARITPERLMSLKRFLTSTKGNES